MEGPLSFLTNVSCNSTISTALILTTCFTHHSEGTLCSDVFWLLARTKYNTIHIWPQQLCCQKCADFPSHASPWQVARLVPSGRLKSGTSWSQLSWMELLGRWVLAAVDEFHSRQHKQWGPKGGVVFVCSGLFPLGLVIRGWLVTYAVLRSNGWNPIIPASCLQSLAREEHSHVCLSC